MEVSYQGCTPQTCSMYIGKFLIDACIKQRFKFKQIRVAGCYMPPGDTLTEDN